MWCRFKETGSSSTSGTQQKYDMHILLILKQVAHFTKPCTLNYQFPSQMSRTKLLVRFSCQNLCIDALLCAEPIQWTFWFAFDTHSAWSKVTDSL
jgi:hypothetical protein